MNSAKCCRRIRSLPASIIPGIGPEHAYLKDTGARNTCRSPTAEALRRSAAQPEKGIIPALESAHAVAQTMAARQESAKTDHCRQFVRARRKDWNRLWICRGGERHELQLTDTFPQLKREGRAALIPFMTTWGSGSRNVGRTDRRTGGGRGGHDRARRAVFRPARRRPGHSAARAGRSNIE